MSYVCECRKTSFPTFPIFRTWKGSHDSHTCRRKLDDITYHIFPSNIKTEKESIVKQYVIDFPHGILVSSTSVLLSIAVSSNHIQISNTTSTYSYSSAPNPNSPAKIISHIIKKPLFSKVLFQTLPYLVSHSLLKNPRIP